MAKSLRSKNVQKNKTIKRATSFGDVHAARAARIAEKFQENTRKQQENADPSSTSDQMDVEKKKVSTSGWAKKKKHGNKRNGKKSKKH